MSQQQPSSEREFARVPVRLHARIETLTSGQAEALAETLAEFPSVWGPEAEAALRQMETSPPSPALGTVARALLELSDQVARLRDRVFRPAGPMEPAEVLELSGGGARLRCSVILRPGDLLRLRFEDDPSGVPPLQVLGEVVHRDGPADGPVGVRFRAIHPVDGERLIRFLYRVQRQRLRQASQTPPPSDT